MVLPYNPQQPPQLHELADVAAHIGEDVAPTGWLDTISAVASNAQQLFVRAVAYMALPSPGYYREKITLLREELEHKTGAHIASETAKVIAMRQVHKFTYLLAHHDLLSKEDAEQGPLKSFLTYYNGKVTLSEKGQAFLGVLQDHTELVQETFEVNILKALCNGIEYFKSLRAHNPHFLVQFVQDVMKETVSPSQDAVSNDEFMQSIQEHIMEALFPNGEADIELPRDMQQLLSKNAFIMLQEKTLPQKMKKIYEKATSEVTKYKLIAKAVKQIKIILTTAPEAKVKKSDKTKSSYPPAKQKEFNAALSGITREFISQIDSNVLTKLKPLILKGVESQGPKIVEKLLAVDTNTLINRALKETCKRLNSSGSWQKEGDRDVFHFVPAPILVGKAKELKEQETLRKNKQQIDETINTIAEDLEGFITRLGGKEKTYSNKIQQSIYNFFNRARTRAVRFAFKVLGVDSQISSISKKVLAFGKKIKPEQALKPFQRVISKKK